MLLLSDIRVPLILLGLCLIDKRTPESSSEAVIYSFKFLYWTDNWLT